MHKGYAMVREMVKHFPLPLLDLKDKKLIAYANSIIPYSTGIEIEVAQKDLSEKELKKIAPNLMDVNLDPQEQRIRLQPGIQGMVDLYNCLELIKQRTVLNPDSGIHYHIDFSKNWDLFYNRDRKTVVFINDNYRWMLNSLDKWPDKGNYNARAFSTDKRSWVRIHDDYTTLEFRIGEMSFDYSLIIKRIMNCQNIVGKLNIYLEKKWGEERKDEDTSERKEKGVRNKKKPSFRKSKMRRRRLFS